MLVHGEPERNDMVQYFGEQMLGFAFTQERLGAVIRARAARAPADQSFGDVSLVLRMTVFEWITYAQVEDREGAAKWGC